MDRRPSSHHPSRAQRRGRLAPDRGAEPTALVIGAGASGLATAASLAREGVPFRLVDRRGEVGGAYRHMHAGITLASPTRYTLLPGLGNDAAGEYITAPEYAAYLTAYAERFALQPEAAEVSAVQRQADGFRVSFVGGEAATFQALVVATGIFDFPVRPDIPGLPEDGEAGPERPAVVHARNWRGPQEHPGRSVLVVGAATSAVEIAEECARAGVPVTVATRGGVRIWPQRFFGRDLHDYLFLSESWPRWLLGSYCDRRPTLPGTDLGFNRYRRQGRITVRGEVTRFQGRSAFFADTPHASSEVADAPQASSEVEVDTVVLATGYSWSAPFLPPEVSRASAGHPIARGGESVGWPGLFFVGCPCARRLNSEFLRGVSRDAPAVARAIARR